MSLKDSIPKEAFRERYLKIFAEYPVMSRSRLLSIEFVQPDRCSNNGNCFKVSVSNGAFVIIHKSFKTEKELLKYVKKYIDAISYFDIHGRAKNDEFNYYMLNRSYGVNLLIKFAVPYTKYYKEVLEKSKALTDSKNDKFTYMVSDKLFHGKYNTKMVLKFKKYLNEDEFLNTIEPIFNIFGEEEESEEHKFSANLILAYKNILFNREKSNKKKKPLTIPHTFTVFLDQPESTSYISIFNNILIKIVKMENIILVKENQYESNKPNAISETGNTSDD